MLVESNVIDGSMEQVAPVLEALQGAGVVEVRGLHLYRRDGGWVLEPDRAAALREVADKVRALPQPTLGLAGGVNRAAVLATLTEVTGASE